MHLGLSKTPPKVKGKVCFLIFLGEKITGFTESNIEEEKSIELASTERSS